MKTKTIVAVCLLGALAACTPSNKDGKAGANDSTLASNGSDTIAVKQVSVNDSLVQGEYKMLAEYDIDYPESGNEYLLNNVREWINESMGGKYTGEIADADKMVNYYVKQNITPEEAKLEWNTDMMVSLKKTYETDKYVTFCNTTYSYSGGAHGMTFTGGNTFRKSDGRKFGWDMFRSDFDYTEMFKEALMKQYFKVNTNEELDNSLQLMVPGYLPKPVTEPFFTEDGVVFVYQQYEIACYAAGAPTFTIPYSKIEKYLTVTAQNLLK